MKLLKQFIQQETVLTAAAVLAVVSAFFVPPDAQYLGYIDLRTLAILFSLMTVMAGLRRPGLFDCPGRGFLCTFDGNRRTQHEQRPLAGYAVPEGGKRA